jgi:hypothetical protein
MVPLDAARIADLGPDDSLHVQCACQNLAIFPLRYLVEGLGLRPEDRIAVSPLGCGVGSAGSGGRRW